MENKNALDLHKKLNGKISVSLKEPLTSENLPLIYTPGVADVSLEIAKNKNSVYDLTIKGNTVAVISDGSAILGIGNLGPEAALPVMEGKAALFKKFADINAFPICLDTQDANEIIKTVKYLAPVFGGINLEDISAPRCFQIEEALQDIGIPVFHDDQHGTAIVVYAALTNAAKVVKKKINEMKVVINGAGAAGTAIAKLLTKNVKDLIVVDSSEAIYRGRNDLNEYKKQLASMTNKNNEKGSLGDVIKGADVFIGVSKPGILKPEMVRSMAKDSIIFALANPTPEIMPDEAKKAGAKIVATGRSDFPNQVNNALAFPGVFKGLLENRIKRVTEKMKINAALALASIVQNPSPDEIVPKIFDKGIVSKVSDAIKMSV